MQRRYQVHLEKLGQKPAKRRLVQPNHPRNPDHPKHAEWLVKIRKRSRGFWDKLSPAKKKARLATMLAARRAKQKPKVKMEAK